jgi:hypothetical protein
MNFLHFTIFAPWFRIRIKATKINADPDPQHSREKEIRRKAASTVIKSSAGLNKLNWQEDIVHLSLCAKTAPTLQCSLANSVSGVPRARLQAAFQLLLKWAQEIWLSASSTSIYTSCAGISEALVAPSGILQVKRSIVVGMQTTGGFFRYVHYPEDGIQKQ